MTTTPISRMLLVFLLVTFRPGNSCLAQSGDLNPEKWATLLGKKDYRVNDSVRVLNLRLQKADSSIVFPFLDQLAEAGKSNGEHFQARFNCLKAMAIYFRRGYYTYYQERKIANLNLIKDQITKLHSSALDIAYRSEDDYLIAFVSYTYASVAVMLGETGLSVMYAKNGIDLYEKLSYPVRPELYQFLSEILYRVREYDECIHYAKKAVMAWQKSDDEARNVYTVNCLNTVALGYHRQEIFDSAFVYYKQALKLAKEIKDTVWTGIVSGNMGQVFYAQGKYDTAYVLLKADYKASKEKGYYDNAANSLQWAARTDLALGKKAEALAEVREAFQLLKLWPDANYLRNAYYTATQIFREMGAYDSAFHYNNLWSVINDSLEKVVATSSLAITKARLNDERSRYNIQSLNKEKREQLFLRNSIIISIIILSLVALLMVNRQLLKQKIKTGKAEQEKLRMEQEMASARDQLKMFTENIVEKTNLIEKLEGQVKNKEATTAQQDIISELSRQTILTEEDWIKFKSLFEIIYPVFFTKLKDRFPDITIAEQRMAALTRLHLTTKQIASMLGISVDSVHKSRQRLRQRFQVGTDTNLDELVATL